MDGRSGRVQRSDSPSFLASARGSMAWVTAISGVTRFQLAPIPRFESRCSTRGLFQSVVRRQSGGGFRFSANGPKALGARLPHLETAILCSSCLRGTRRCEITYRSIRVSRSRAGRFSPAGSALTNLCTACWALIVFIVESTRCPVSAASSASSVVSRSLSSPTAITFGACRRAALHGMHTLGVSLCSSR